jgi:hypothetical protein
LLANTTFAQDVNIIQNLGREQTLQQFEVLPDSNYSFEQIKNNNNLRFTLTDSLRGATAYWLKVIAVNHSHSAEAFELNVYPNFDNTLYYYSAIEEKWLAHRSKFSHTSSPWQVGTHYYEIPAQQLDTLYVRINVDAPNLVDDIFKAELILTPKSLIDDKKGGVFTAWIVGITILLLFFLNNLYIYFSFKDKTTGYYLVLQLGGMIYLTAYCHYFDRVLPPYVFSFVLGNRLSFYSEDMLIIHAAVVIVFYGLIQLCRSYLDTKTTLPSFDKLLKYGVNSYIVICAVLMVINICFFNIDYYTIIYDNIFCLLLMILTAVTSIKAYINKLPTAGAFLLANISPLILLCCLPLYHVLIAENGSRNYWLPVIVSAALALSFSIALVSRIKTIRDTLRAKEIESQQLAFDLKETAYKNQLHEKEIERVNANIKVQLTQNELLNDKLEGHQRELAASALFMVQKNELLTQLKTQINTVKRADRYEANRNLNEMLALLNNNKEMDAGWDKFKIHFEQVHPSFFEDLKKNHPTLTQKETRLYTYFKMQLSHKEIAALVDIDQASVRRAKTRLLKKMNQPDTE